MAARDRKAAIKKGAMVRAYRWRLKRDEQVRRVVARFAQLADLEDLKYRPALRSLSKTTLLLERCYERLRDRKDLTNAKGELCASIDTFRRLADSQFAMLKAVGLLPNAPLPSADDFDAAFERIEGMKKLRDTGRNGKPIKLAEPAA